MTEQGLARLTGMDASIQHVGVPPSLSLCWLTGMSDNPFRQGQTAARHFCSLSLAPFLPLSFCDFASYFFH
jgi:hypothetical protein